MENEDEHPLQGVEDGEEVRHHYGGFIEEEQAKGPCEPQQTEKGECPQHPRPAKRERRSILTSETVVEVVFAWFGVSLLLVSSLLKRQKKQTDTPICYFPSREVAQEAAWCRDADAKFQQSMCILHLTRQKYVLPVFLAVAGQRDCEHSRFPGKPRRNKITSQSLSMTAAGRY